MRMDGKEYRLVVAVLSCAFAIHADEIPLESRAVADAAPHAHRMGHFNPEGCQSNADHCQNNRFFHNASVCFLDVGRAQFEARPGQRSGFCPKRAPICYFCRLWKISRELRRFFIFLRLVLPDLLSSPSPLQLSRQ